MEKKIKVCWISNIPSPYKVDLMNLLAKDIELFCLFEHHEFENREKSWYNLNFNFKSFYLPENNTIKLLCKMAKECDCLINSDYSKPVCMLAVELFKLYKKPTILQADGGIAEDRGFIINKVMSLVMNRNNYFLSSGQETDKYFNNYGVTSDKIYHYHFTTYFKDEIKANHKLSLNRDDLRKRLKLQGDFIVFSVGQQIHRKGYDVLAKACLGLNEKIHIYIAGGMPNAETKKIIEDNSIKNIHFIGFKSRVELFEYYAASDIFVLPTRYDIWGLVINEAMSFGLPIISTNKCVAAVEFNNISNIGYIVNVDDEKQLHDKIEALFNDRCLVKEFSHNSFETIKNYHLENMQEDYKYALYSIIYTKN